MLAGKDSDFGRRIDGNSIPALVSRSCGGNSPEAFQMTRHAADQVAKEGSLFLLRIDAPGAQDTPGAAGWAQDQGFATDPAHLMDAGIAEQFVAMCAMQRCVALGMIDTGRIAIRQDVVRHDLLNRRQVRDGDNWGQVLQYQLEVP